MLIVKVLVNNRQIDEIKIQNISGDFTDFQNYAIRQPQVDDIIISHRREKGYMPLLQKALEILISKKENK